MNITNKEIDCPLCGKSKINISVIPAHYDFKTVMAVHQKRRIPVYHPEKIEANSKCSYCKATIREIKEALERGKTKQISHEERLRRIKEAGLPTMIEG